jgi:hypothetical protein
VPVCDNKHGNRVSGMGSGPSTVGRKHTSVALRAEPRVSVMSVIHAGQSLSRPELTAGEVSQGGIERPLYLGGQCGCECLQAIKTRRTVSEVQTSTSCRPVSRLRHRLTRWQPLTPAG